MIHFATSVFEHLAAIAFWAIIIWLIGSFLKIFVRGNRVFVSFPMASVSGSEVRAEYKEKLQKLTNSLKANFGLNTYCAYHRSADKFDDSRKAFVECFQEIRKCKYFVVILTEKLATSAYVEVGYALAKRKSVLIIHTHAALPFLLEELESAGVPLTGGRVLARRIQVNSVSGAFERLEENGLRDFPGLAKAIKLPKLGH